MRAGRARACWQSAESVVLFSRRGEASPRQRSAKGTLSIAYQINGESRLLSIEEAL